MACRLILGAAASAAPLAAADGDAVQALLATPAPSRTEIDEAGTFWHTADADGRIRLLDAIAERRIGSLRSAVREGLASPAPALAARACRALAAIGVAEAGEVDALRALLDRAETPVRLAALTALVELDDDGTAASVIGWIDDPELGPAAEAAIRRLMPDGLPADPAAWSAWLRREDDRATAALAAAEPILASGDRTAIIRQLGSLAADRNLRGVLAPAIAPLLRHADPRVARSAELALRQLRGPHAAIALARHGEDASRALAALAAAEPAPSGGGAGWLAAAGIAAAALAGGALLLRRRPGAAAGPAAPATIRITRSIRADGTRAIRRVVTFADGSQVAVTRTRGQDGTRTHTRRQRARDGSSRTVTRTVRADGTRTVTRSHRRADGTGATRTRSFARRPQASPALEARSPQPPQPPQAPQPPPAAAPPEDEAGFEPTPMRTPLPPRRGTSLIEVMIAAAVLAVIMTALVGNWGYLVAQREETDRAQEVNLLLDAVQNRFLAARGDQLGTIALPWSVQRPPGGPGMDGPMLELQGLLPHEDAVENIEVFVEYFRALPVASPVPGPGLLSHSASAETFQRAVDDPAILEPCRLDVGTGDGLAGQVANGAISEYDPVLIRITALWGPRIGGTGMQTRRMSVLIGRRPYRDT